MEIISSDDDGSLHLGGDNNAFKDFSSDGNVAGEWTLLINVGRFNCLLGSFESKTDVLEISDT